MTDQKFPKIRWAPPVRPVLLKRLYDSHAAGFQDIDLCDKVGIYLYTRCNTFVLTSRGEVECPVCFTVLAVLHQGKTTCPTAHCGWNTTWPKYRQSIRNYNAGPGTAINAFRAYHTAYPGAKTYGEKIILIDQLIHSFHMHEKTGALTKSVASKLFEGNKKDVVGFLDDLSALSQEGKELWRRTMVNTIDARIVNQDRR